MGRRSDEQAGDAPASDPPRAPGVPAGERRGGDARPPAEPDAAETEKARTEIEAGDVADDLAGFA